ncbi:hypothetical protein FOZ60_001672 [Perkinsus olseni]|uniref:C3H1-type domain-containing protein n=1 Tax=Perkinsus olseni TaxID=32597 RepID=A0A7J6NZW3_PEROL|nr:hypothetical protein FOZ60_001672 [Perkinsus olseni]
MSDQDPPVPVTPLSLPHTGYYAEEGVHIPRAIAHSDVAITRHRRLQKTKLCRYGEHCTYRPLGRCFYAHSEEELKERPPKTEEEILAEQMEAAHNIAMQDQADDDMWGHLNMWPHPAPAPAPITAAPTPFGLPMAAFHQSAGTHSACWIFAMQAAAVAEAARLSATEAPVPQLANANAFSGMDYHSWAALKYAQNAIHISNRGIHQDIPTASASVAASVRADQSSDGGGGTPDASSVPTGKDDLEETQSAHGGIEERNKPGIPLPEKARSR